MKSTFTIILLAVVASLAVSPETEAQTMVGGRLGFYTGAGDLSLGGEILAPVSGPVWFNPNVEYVFLDRANFATFNFDFHYDFPARNNLLLWAGAGPAILYRDPDGPAGGDTDLGANFLFGVGFPREGVVPYIQAKLIAADDADFTIGFGIRF